MENKIKYFVTENKKNWIVKRVDDNSVFITLKKKYYSKEIVEKFFRGTIIFYEDEIGD